MSSYGLGLGGKRVKKTGAVKVNLTQLGLRQPVEIVDCSTQQVVCRAELRRCIGSAFPERQHSVCIRDYPAYFMRKYPNLYCFRRHTLNSRQQQFHISQALLHGRAVGVQTLPIRRFAAMLSVIGCAAMRNEATR